MTLQKRVGEDSTCEEFQMPAHDDAHEKRRGRRRKVSRERTRERWLAAGRECYGDLGVRPAESVMRCDPVARGSGLSEGWISWLASMRAECDGLNGLVNCGLR